MPGFCASIVFAFISVVKLYGCVVDGGICESLAGGEGQQVIGLKPQDGGGGELNPQDAMM